MKKIFLTIAALCLFFPLTAQEMATITLLPPQTDKGLPVMKALSERKSTRAFDNKELDLQTLSNLLWAANGVNRPDGKRTAPSTLNRQDIDIYLCDQKGAWLYNAKEHVLKQISKVNTGCIMRRAPVTLILVANGKEDDRAGELDAGVVSQNISLFAAGMGLATVPQSSMMHDIVKRTLALGEDQRPVLNHPVGYIKPGHVEEDTHH